MTFVQRRQSRRVPAPRPVASSQVPLTAADEQQARQALHRHTTRPVTAQRQQAAPVLRAASLDRAEVARLESRRQGVQAQLSVLPAPAGQPTRPPARPVPARPVTPDEWVTVLRHRAEGIEGRRLDTRAFGEFQALQRQVAQTLAQGFRADRGDAQARYATYGEQLATLQRHALSAPVARVVLGMVPPSERLPLQRAADEALQRFQAQEQAALNFESLQTLQRQLAELDAEATQPVLQRIQARRGGGNPLPEAVRRHLEQGLNHDLSRVRIHDDAEADKLAKGVHAIAFTTGTDIFFQAGRFDPNTRGGLELLAHEVTHTVQQSQGRVGTGIDPDAGLESEARVMGARLAQVMPSSKSLLPPVPHQEGPHAPGVYTRAAALTRVQAGAAHHALLTPLRALQRQPDLTLQRSVIGDRLGDLARGIPGYTPLTMAMGFDPVAGKAVKADPNVLLDALARFVPGPFKDMVKVVREQKLLPKAWAWFQGELGKLRLGNVVTGIKAALSGLPNLVKARDLLVEATNSVRRLVLGSARKLADIALTAITAGLGPVGKKLMGNLRQSGDIVTQVLKNPGQFAVNLMNALRQGFLGFVGRSGQWIQQGLGDWLSGSANIQFPRNLNVEGVLMTALSIMNLGYDALRARLIRELGPGAEGKVALLEKAGGALGQLRGNVGKAPELRAVATQLSGEVLGGIKADVTETLVKKGVQRVALMFSPAGAAVGAILTAWNTVQTVIDKGQQIMGVIMTALGSVREIAAGRVASAARFIEQTIGKALPVVFSFAGRMLGIGNIGARLKKLVQGMRQKLGIDKLIDAVMARLKKLVGGVRTAGRNPAFAAPKNASEARNQTYADESSRTLQALKQKKLPYDALRAEATNVARFLERRYNRVIDRPAKMTISFPAAAADRRDHTLDYRIHIGPNDTNLTGSVPAFDEATATKDQVRAAIDGAGGIIPFMYALSRGESPGGISRQKLDGLWSRKEIRDDVIKARFRGALNAGEHEWIPTNLLREVIDRTAGTVSGIQAADWIDLQHRLRTDTSWIVFRPEYGERLNHADGNAYFVFKGHVGAVYLRTATRPKELTTHSSTFHDELRRAFDVSKTVNQSVAKARAVIKKWVWDGVGEPGINEIHPQLLWTKGRLSLKDPRNYSLMKSSLARQFIHINALLDLNRS
ncbi:DUF4157 domain-containing protein [Deinococcus sp. 23YEL01]|uniref:eCIS core domain-containing protein n=1 Tax=Deinococcus sp. 23YEL01 TaxID=2745871 RepID=UPI001E6304D0|nr:DUF4157 domain-containing protein [Deinococcus sp. 23YEL01]MCD0168972.1 DUF4157 domain-containing protein [Deinococcus sp. 23YEL01]